VAAAGAPQIQGVLSAEPEHPGRGVLPAEPGHPADDGRGVLPDEPGHPADDGRGVLPDEPGHPADEGQGVLPAEPGHPARGVLSDEQEHPADEAREAKPARDPGAPTQAMRDAHAATHLPFRSWCDECVQGRRDAPPHCRSKRAAGEVPEVAFDYAFVRRDDEEEVATLLVMRDRDSKAIRAWVLERKGADLAETVHRAVAGVRDLGYRGRVLIRTDGEPALVALRNAITQALPDGATPISTPVGESASNGGIEGAVKIVKGLLRVHLAALERRLGAKFPSGHPVLTWLVEHVGDIVSKYMVGLDGRTAYERLFGRPVREEGLEFGETLHWHHRATRDMNVVLDARWSSGVWLGRRWGGVVHHVFANGKVHEIRGVQRQPRDARWRREALEAVTATPWNREPAAEGELRVLPPLAAPAAAAGAGEPEVREVEYNPHRPFIKLADLERFGFTAGCRRCTLMREGRKAQGVKHGDECRLRVEQCLRDAGDPRLARAERRALDELERRAAVGEPRLAEAPAAPNAHPAGEGPRLAEEDFPPDARPAEHAAMEEEPPAEAAAGAAAPPPPLAADRAHFERDYALWDAGGDAVMRVGPASAAGSAPKAGAAPPATKFAYRSAPAKISELYSPPRVTALLPKLGLVAGSTFDLCADVAGVAWDFTRPDDRRRALERIRAEEPFLVVGSPPCTMFSRLQLNLNAKKMGKEVWEKRRREAEVLLVFAAVVYKLQVQAGRHFLHEHPAGATSWQHPAIVRLLAAPGVGAVVAHQCQFGLETSAAGGGRAPALKPTRFMSSARAVLEALSKKCPGDHVHAPLLGGTRARDAAVYPPALCKAIAEGASEQLRRDVSSGSRSLQAVRPQSAEVHCLPSDSRVRDEAAELAAWPAADTHDEITGAVLPPNLVKLARAEEIKFMLEWNVWERATIADCWKETGKAPIGSKWVDVNKGDAKNPLIRSRFVVKEIATYKTDDFFAATPPLEAFRLLLSLAASGAPDTKIEVLDARKAHLHAFADRTVFTQLPPEEAAAGYCARLVRCLYGTRDAPKRWEAFLAEQLVALGFAKGAASPCCYFHASLGVRCIVHGDDFVLSGSACALDEVKAGMHARFLLKELGRLGGGPGELRELRVLNRVIRWTPAGLKYEADPRHVEILVRGVAGAERALSAPGTHSKDYEGPTEAGPEDVLPAAVASLFRSFAARANYLAMDRPDLAQATKELCRRMSDPRAADLQALGRVARYLLGAARVVYEYPWQQRPVLKAYTDSDFAGCVASRLSTSGGAVLLGKHLLKHWASTQKKITLSSGEAELGAVVRGLSEVLGLQSVARDLGVELKPEVHADSSAAIGICNRSGIGKVRHLAVAQLWVQDFVRTRACRLFKVLGTENPADLMTKPLARAEIDGHLARLGLSRASGRAETAPRADAAVDTTLADLCARQRPAR
jgi:hypothetical protein